MSKLVSLFHELEPGYFLCFYDCITMLHEQFNLSSTVTG